MKGLANISNPLKWPGMLSGRTKSSGAASNSNAVGLDGFANDPDNARRELGSFLHKLCTRREFGAKHMHVSSASLIDMSRQVQDEEVQDVAAGFGPRSLPVAMDEATCIDIVTTFCLRRLLTRAVAEELLTRAATELAKLPNVVEYTVPEGCFITIVGDLHGQFQDLMHIFRSYGFPSPTRPYLFNGDFVDRGDCGVEITLTLLAFQQYLPGSVLLNRGNHEERSVHMLMGFHQECCSKYDKEIYEMFNVAFAQLPIATVINGAVCVVHGGIDSKVSLDQIRKIPRAEYQTYAGSMGGGKPGLVHPLMREKMEKIRQRAELMHPINSCLWNDPINVDGEAFNKTRGTGLLFGPDVCKEFLVREGLQLLIRSHEMTPDGYDWPFGDNLLHGCITIFSASNYACSATNRGGVVRLGAPKSKAPSGVKLGESDAEHRIGKRGRSSGAQDDEEGLPSSSGAAAAPPMFGGKGGGGGGMGFGLQKSRSNVMALIEAGGGLKKDDDDDEEGEKDDDEEEEQGGPPRRPSLPPKRILERGLSSTKGESSSALNEDSSDRTHADDSPREASDKPSKQVQREASMSEPSELISSKHKDKAMSGNQQPVDAHALETHTSWYEMPFGAFCCESYDSGSIKPLRRSQRRTHQLYELLLANREHLREACQDAEKEGGGRVSGGLPLGAMTKLCGEELGLDAEHTANFGAFLAALVDPSGGDKLAVHELDAALRIPYAAILDRVALVENALLSLYEVHFLLLACLFRLDATGTGFVTLPMFEMACGLLAAQFPKEAAMCTNPQASAKVLSIWSIAMSFVVIDARYTGSSRGVVSSESAKAAVGCGGEPESNEPGADASSSGEKLAHPNSEGAWAFHLQQYARMATLHHQLQIVRLAELARSTAADQRSLPVPSSPSPTSPKSPKPPLLTKTSESTLDARLPPSTKGSSLVLPDADEESAKKKKELRSRVRRGSIPYSVISQHMFDENLALPPRHVGIDHDDVEDLPHAKPVGLTRQNSGHEAFAKAAIDADAAHVMDMNAD